MTEGAFPALIRALHDSDVSQHPHPQVVLVYFEIAHRYIRYLDRPAVLRLFQTLLGSQGVLSGNALLRGRAAYFLLKVAETQEGKAANVLEAVLPQLTGKKTVCYMCVPDLLVICTLRWSTLGLAYRIGVDGSVYVLGCIAVVSIPFHRSNVALDAFRLVHFVTRNGAKIRSLAA
jgi:hypothetical protein